jgi:hypothetical protein
MQDRDLRQRQHGRQPAQPAKGLKSILTHEPDHDPRWRRYWKGRTRVSIPGALPGLDVCDRRHFGATRDMTALILYAPPGHHVSPDVMAKVNSVGNAHAGQSTRPADERHCAQHNHDKLRQEVISTGRSRAATSPL